MRSRHRIANRSVTGEVRAVDFTYVAEVRRDDCAGQRAIEVSNQSETETTRYVDVATKRNLVGWVEQRRTVVPPRFVIVRRLQHEILIAVRRGTGELCPARVAEVGEAVSG